MFSNNESPAYLSEQLITYIGNKRALLQFIGRAIGKVQGRLGKDRLRLLDLFSGSGIVSRYFKRFADLLVVNDLERYCEVINRCYLANRSDLDVGELESIHAELTGNLAAGPLVPGIITNRYAPQNDEDIQEGERVFYTNRNARYLDTARKYIAALPPGLQHFFLAPLLSEASIHANTAGVFKGFYKDRDTGIGKFGGKNGDALLRIKGDITLPFPVFSNYECPVAIHRKPAEELAGALASDMAEFDLAYLDPPYNQHPYGSNYFMLNLLADYCEPESISEVSGIPGNWERSDFNKPRRAYDAMKNIVDDLPAKFILVSFNSEGFITRQRMMALLSRIGSVELLETSYNTFRGSRNLRNRNIHVKEFLFLVEKK
ncbi:MAG: DNA adenine methylase [Spirochaetales bacterium]|nr:DNA adenine methylase [Spirochaetales bacterium]